MAFAEPNLPQGGATMRPKIIAHETDRRLQVLRLDLFRLWHWRHRPVEISERACQPERVRRHLSNPIALAAVEVLLEVVDKLPEFLECRYCWRRQWNGPWRKRAILILADFKVDDPCQPVDDLRLDLGHFVGQGAVRRFDRPREATSGVHPIEVAGKRSGQLIGL